MTYMTFFKRSLQLNISHMFGRCRQNIFHSLFFLLEFINLLIPGLFVEHNFTQGHFKVECDEDESSSVTFGDSVCIYCKYSAK